MIVTRGQNEYRVYASGVTGSAGQTGSFYPAVGNPSGFVTTGQTGVFLDTTSTQTVSGSKTFTATTSFNGMVLMPYNLVTGSYYVTNSDFTIDCIGSSSVNLSGASPTRGRILNIKNSYSGNMTLTPRPLLIDNTTGARTLLSGMCLTLQGNGTGWIII